MSRVPRQTQVHSLAQMSYSIPNPNTMSTERILDVSVSYNEPLDKPNLFLIVKAEERKVKP